MPLPDTLSILKRLVFAYPEKKLSLETVQVYQSQLSDVPPWLLERAVDQHIASSPWFPHVSDLRLAAQNLSGSTDFANLPPLGVSFLNLAAQQLENDYFQRGLIDPSAWEQVARQLERVGRPHRAAELRCKASHIQEHATALARGEEYPRPEVRQRYKVVETMP